MIYLLWSAKPNQMFTATRCWWHSTDGVFLPMNGGRSPLAHISEGFWSWISGSCGRNSIGKIAPRSSLNETAGER
ncbi:MAG: hypothetical protein CMQ44_11420 [Gammaproteobacteria bacterium]|nr:hypothetical protein [Gammaproteobacteria bacterium]